jgi:hypothetical protein
MVYLKVRTWPNSKTASGLCLSCIDGTNSQMVTATDKFFLAGVFASKIHVLQERMIELRQKMKRAHI